jgi:circadian clock protein KaiC
MAGIPGLDDVLGGGFPTQRLYLIEGDPGSGKTTLALMFLMEGARLGEPVLYITLSETKAELDTIAASHGWSLDNIKIVELIRSVEELEPDNQHMMFLPGDVELGETNKAIFAEVEKIKPKRVVIDSLSELRLLSNSPLRFRRQILSLKQFFVGHEATVLLLDNRAGEDGGLHLQSIPHGVLTLEHLPPAFGGDRRRLRVAKLRGQKFRGGYHDFNIRTGGLDVFPRLIAAEHSGEPPPKPFTGSVPELDALFGGGIEAGTSVLLVGPAGCGKSSVAVSYARAAAGRGERAALFIFDERTETLLNRSAGQGLDLTEQLASGRITIQQVDPAELSPGEFSNAVRLAVEGLDGSPPAKLIVIDSLNGYLHAMPEERYLTAQLHELLTYLGHKGVVTFLVLAQQGMVGMSIAPVDTSYLADSVMLFRYFEARGEVRQAISVAKKRSGKHERTIRELWLNGGIRVGEPLANFQGVLTGVPTFVGEASSLMGLRNG